MTQIDLSASFTSNVFDNLYRHVNHLPISYDDFAIYSSLLERCYGMITGGEEQGITTDEGDRYQSFTVNRCLRKALYSALINTAATAEKFSGVKLSSRYLYHEQTWIGKTKMQTVFPGIEAMEVFENCYDLDTVIDFDYVAQNPVSITVEDGNTVARLDATIFENPSFGILRRSDNNKNLIIDTADSAYPQYDSIPEEWVIKLAQTKVAVAAGDPVFAFHTQHVDMTVIKPDISSLTSGGIIQPVYPGTEQIIEHTIIDENDNDVTYRFPLRVLVAPAFSNELIEWQKYQTYKLYSTFELKYFVEEPEYLTLVWDTGDEEVIYQYDPSDPDASDLPRLLVNTTDPSRGIFQIYLNDALINELYPKVWKLQCPDRRLKQPQTLTVKIPYKVNPELMPEPFKSQVPEIIKAVIHRVAAELPTRSCGCNQEIGFIADQQQKYTKAYQNPYTGVELVDDKYGQRHGQFVYKEIMDEIVVYRPRLLLGARH